MSNFCVMPWYSQEIHLVSNTETVCCWLQDRINLSQLRHDFANGKKPQACRKCWQNENQGIESRRQMENRFLDFKLNRDIEKIQHDAMNEQAQVNLYQVFVGSTCNGTCVTCGPNFSSAWRKIENQQISIREENAVIDRTFEQWSHGVNWAQAKRFNILGGEPLLIKRSFDILKKLIEVSNTDCRVSFVTNGNVMLSPGQIDLITQFSDISCCVSIDGLERTFEYIRYPLSWSTLLRNLEIYREIFTTLEVSFTVSNLNYRERDKIQQWFREQNLLFIENYVTQPEWFAYQVTPDHHLWSKFVQEIKRQDSMKKIRIDDYIPHIAAMINHD